ncbi:MAG: glycosyltransferase family 4 protein [Prevotella sp.]
MMCFYHTFDSSQKLNEEGMRKECKFTPRYLKGITFGSGETRKFCTEVWTLLRSNKPNVVIVPEYQLLTIQVLLYKFIFRKKFKVISMCDDSFDMVNNNNDFTIIHKWARKFIAPLVDDMLLVDSRVRDWYQEHYKKGIWLPIVRDEKKEIPNYERSLPISKKYKELFNLAGRKVLLFVGRFVVEKNLDNFIKALGKTKEDFVTVMVGSGELEGQLRELSKGIGKEIVFAGHYVDDGVRAWYNVADVFVLPSKQEAYGAVTNEALIAGNYSVISESAGSACLITQDNGCLVNPYDLDGMASAIDNAMRMVRHKDTCDVKDNLMPFLFDDIINKVITEIKQ